MAEGENQPASAGRIQSPDGLDLHPQPRRVVRISKRAGMALIVAIIGLLLAYAYGGYRRTARAQAAAREAGVPKNPVPATQAASEVTKRIPEGIAPLTARTTADLHPPGAQLAEKYNPPCGANPQTGLPYRFDPQTGQPCDGLPQERVVVRQAAPTPALPKEIMPPRREPSEQERTTAAAYAREQEARIAPTSTRNSAGPSVTQPNPEAQSSLNGLAQIAALTQPLTNGTAEHAQSATTPAAESEYDEQNMQTRKEFFWAGSQKRSSADYLSSTREAPLSRFEIRAGWEIPALLEQSLNSDLPGDLKALITANVYDTATGQYLLIPQGSRLVGRYDSRVAYGQDGVQVAWSMIIFPDASSIDLNGMAGLDAQGNSGLRDKVDRHYARIVGFSALTSLFSAAFAVSQRQNQSVLAYPTPTEAASSAIAQSLSQTGSQITRRNLNVQPTIKVPAGYKFTVRVNRDILFEAPYEAISPTAPLPERMLRDRNLQQKN